MKIKLDTKVMTSDDHDSHVLRMIMFAVFQDFLEETSAENFQTRYGTCGTECLSKYTKR